MISVVIPNGHYTQMRHKVLKEGLMEKYAQELAEADAIERKNILAKIEAEIDIAVKKEARKWSSSKNDLDADSLKLNGLKWVYLFFCSWLF